MNNWWFWNRDCVFEFPIPHPKNTNNQFKITNWLLYHQLVTSTFSSLLFRYRITFNQQLSSPFRIYTCYLTLSLSHYNYIWLFYFWLSHSLFYFFGISCSVPVYFLFTSCALPPLHTFCALFMFNYSALFLSFLSLLSV